jgi:N-acyl-D-aspartate/D-glutamate deacylase
LKLSLFASLLISSVLLTVLTIPSPAAEPEYDLLIRNGHIVDGSGNPWFYGDVAITGDKIVAVGRVSEGKAKRIIDAKGFVVAPGFID